MLQFLSEFFLRIVFVAQALGWFSGIIPLSLYPFTRQKERDRDTCVITIHLLMWHITLSEKEKVLGGREEHKMLGSVATCEYI